MAPNVFALCSQGAGSTNLHQERASLLSAINGFMEAYLLQGKN